MDRSPHAGLIYAAGSGVFSALIAGGMGRLYGLSAEPLAALVTLSALLAGYFGYRSRMNRE